MVEVPEIIMASPPGPDGKLRPEVLMAARVAGVHRVFKIGGAQAMAALAYGTESVPRVDKIVGPGNIYVATAKKMVFGDVDIDSEAGPTEVLVIADRSADARVARGRPDLAGRARRARAGDPDHAREVARRRACRSRSPSSSRRSSARKIARKSLSTRGAIIVAKDIAECVALANQYAPEHLVIASDDADRIAKDVQNAGAIFLGHYTPVAVGDYLAGPNHVLPTGGSARFFSPLGVDDFLKRTSVIRFEPPKLRELGLDVMRLAAIEGLTGHGRSVDLRLQKIRRARREREAAREAEFEL